MQKLTLDHIFGTTRSTEERLFLATSCVNRQEAEAGVKMEDMTTSYNNFFVFNTLITTDNIVTDI